MSIEDFIKRWTDVMSRVEQAAGARDAESLQAWLSIAQECRLAAGSKLCERPAAGSARSKSYGLGKAGYKPGSRHD